MYCSSLHLHILKAKHAARLLSVMGSNKEQDETPETTGCDDHLRQQPQVEVGWGGGHPGLTHTNTSLIYSSKPLVSLRLKRGEKHYPVFLFNNSSLSNTTNFGHDIKPTETHQTEDQKFRFNEKIKSLNHHLTSSAQVLLNRKS